MKLQLSVREASALFNFAVQLMMHPSYGSGIEELEKGMDRNREAMEGAGAYLLEAGWVWTLGRERLPVEIELERDEAMSFHEMAAAAPGGVRYALHLDSATRKLGEALSEIGGIRKTEGGWIFLVDSGG